MFCTYVTFYKGNKLPPFYIGYTKVSNVQKGYHGSVSSKMYKDTWLEEIKNNIHLFETRILSIHEKAKDALEKEKFFQKKMNVIKNPLYMNQAIGFYSDNTGRKFSEESKKKIGDKHRGKKKGPLSKEVKAKISASLKGRKKSEEIKSLISKTLKGHSVSLETREKLRRKAIAQWQRSSNAT